MGEIFVIASWVRMCLDAFRQMHLDVDALLRLAGLDEAQLNDPLAPIPLAPTRILFEAALEQTQNPLLGIEIAKRVSFTTFHALGFSVMASHSLHEGFMRIQRFANAITNVGTAHLKEEGAAIVFSFPPPEPDALPHDIAIDMTLTLLIRICRLMVPGPSQLIKVEMARAKPPHGAAYERYIKAPILWNAPRYAIHFEREYFQKPMPHANPALALENDRLCEKYLETLASALVTRKVRHWLKQALADTQLSIASAARSLNVSERTLQRQLSQEGTSFRAVLDDVRRQAAQGYLETPVPSICQIAHQLGFTDAGNFCRAFKRWFQCSPEEYRKRLKSA